MAEQGYAWRVSFEQVRYCFAERFGGSIEIPWARLRWQAIQEALRQLEEKHGLQPGSLSKSDLIGRRTVRMNGPMRKPEHQPRQLTLAL